MKQICLFLMVLFCLGCANDDADRLSLTESIWGTWQLEARRISPGGTVAWNNVQFSATYQFKPEGSFSFTVDPNFGNNQTGTYTIEDGILILNTTSTDQNTEQRSYSIDINGKELTLDFIGCIEACSERFTRL